MLALLLPADLGPALDSAQPALALSDVQQLVVDAWRLVNQSYVDPARLEAVQWRRLRQKTLEQPIISSAQAYDAIESMLEPIGDPYTRMLRPADFGSLQSNTRGTVCGVGLQLGLRPSDQAATVGQSRFQVQLHTVPVHIRISNLAALGVHNFFRVTAFI